MKVKKLIELLKRAREDADVFQSGLNKNYESRSLTLTGKIEDLGNYVVIVGDK